jgi:serine/threonine protein kinase
VKSKELDTILLLDDPCLMKCHYWSQDVLYCYYLMDLMDTTLDEALYEKTIELSDRDKFKIIQDVVHGCKVLHSKKIVHKDLKPLNILLKRNKSGTIVSKISDFGISRVKQTESDSSVTFGFTGTIRYLPLEFLQGQVYGYFTDVYAFGVILFEILFEEHPWKGCKSSDELIEELGKGKTLTSTKSCGKEWKDMEIIMKQCLGKADQRLSFEEIEKKVSQMDASKFQSKLIKISVEKDVPKVENQINKEAIQQPVSKVEKGVTLEKQNKKVEVQIIQAPKIEQEIWTYHKVIATFKVPENLKGHIRRLFENDPLLTTLNLGSTSLLNSFSSQSNWS